MNDAQKAKNYASILRKMANDVENGKTHVKELVLKRPVLEADVTEDKDGVKWQTKKTDGTFTVTIRGYDPDFDSDAPSGD